MEEGVVGKRTIFVGNLGEEVNETDLLAAFSTFGDVIDVQLPSAATNPNLAHEGKHRGYGFVTFASQSDAMDAIDNMDMNVLKDRVLKVNLAKTTKITGQGMGNRAIWESEEWLKQYAKPLDESGGKGAKAPTRGDAKDGEGDDGQDEMEE